MKLIVPKNKLDYGLTKLSGGQDLKKKNSISISCILKVYSVIFSA